MATEAQLAIMIVSALNAGLAVRGVSAIVQKDQQPRQQGVPSTATIFFHHAGTVNVGWVDRREVWDSVNSVKTHTETQRRESRYQIGALAPQSPASPTAPTPADFCAWASAIMQSSATIEYLAAQGVGVQHITNIQSTYFVDDLGRNEENPSFDIVLSHQDVFSTAVPVIQDFEAGIYPI